MLKLSWRKKGCQNAKIAEKIGAKKTSRAYTKAVPGFFMSENMCTNKIILDEKDLFLSIFKSTVYNQFSKTGSIIQIHN